ncbi:MAG: hypothetical protein JWQ21_257 [Herminiimonas sp.]|nr:hypothetical protein [Herminiimonas sp.]
MATDFSSGMSDNDPNPVNASAAGSPGPGIYDDAAGTAQQSSSKLREELANLKSDLDALMAHASTLTDRELGEARDRIMAKFSSMRQSAKGMAAEAGKQINHGVDLTSEYVKERPLQSVAIATGVGLVLGAVLRRH